MNSEEKETEKRKRKRKRTRTFGAMAENYYSTLTSDLAKQYKIKLASKLTAYNPKSITPFHDLVHLTDEESSDNLERLLSLKRNEVFRREQENALELVGIRRRKKRREKRKANGGRKVLARSGPWD